MSTYKKGSSNQMSLFYKETATVSIEFKQGNRHRVRRITGGY
ncbi:MAG: hypothetical protein PUH91_12550 [Prevotella sp.]|nr:hypothetical protein [Prevotella sp.]